MDVRDVTDVRTVDDVIVIKPKFLASIGCHIFLTYGAPRGAPLKTPIVDVINLRINLSIKYNILLMTCKAIERFSI